MAESLSSAKSARDALVHDATDFLSTASELTEENRQALADYIARAAAANTMEDITEATAALQQAYDRMRGN